MHINVNPRGIESHGGRVGWNLDAGDSEDGDTPVLRDAVVDAYE